ncbi:MAG TPA: ABC transporter permease [Pyrinomonadaceae bacterium]
MNKLTELWRKLYFYLRREQFERDLQDEIQLHLEMKAAENEAAGMSPEEARLLAQREFGNPLLLREDSRAVWSFVFFETFLMDFRYALRMMIKSPAFSTVAIFALALGIGANTAIFSVVNAVLLRPLSYPDAEQLVELGRAFPESDFGDNLSEPKFVFLHDQNKSFSALMATQGMGPNTFLSDGNRTEFISGMTVSADFFKVLGVYPVRGREFSKAEDSPGGPPVAIINDGLWRRYFGSDEAILGKTIPLNGEAYTVVGVMPAGFEYLGMHDVFVPMQTNPTSKNEGHNYTVIGRLKPGVTEPQARSEATILFNRFRDLYPHQVQDNETFGARNWRANMTGGVAQLLWILLGAVGLVLLIACANVANLQLTRASARQKEMAIRISIGGGNLRLIRQLITEGLVLAFVGGGAGLLLALWGLNITRKLLPEDFIPRANEIGMDWRVLIFCLLATVVTGIVFGLAPAIYLLRADLSSSLKEGINKALAAGVSGRLRNALVIAEIALALALTVGAGLLLRTFANLRSIEPGFDPKNLLSFAISPEGKNYDQAKEITELYLRAMDHFRNVPGVEDVAVTSKVPFDSQLNLPYRLASQTEFAGAVQYRLISPEYFRVMKMSLRQGRQFTSDDQNNSEPVAIVNEAFVRRNFSNNSALGQQLCVGCEKFDPAMRRIVGVVNDTKQRGLDTPAPSTVYLPLTQTPEDARGILRGAIFVVRTSGESLALSAPIQNELHQIDPNLPFRHPRSMDQLVARSVAPQRFNLSLLSLFSAIGLLLSAIGIYGVMAYNVSQRTHEIGLRMALGAQTRQILGLVLRQGMTLALVGTVLGLGLALSLTRVMKKLLFGVSATDPLTLVLVSLVLMSAAFLACYLPARRAARVDPLVALRHE